MDQESWEERYRSRPVWSGEPNEQLVFEASDLPPGSALDVGCGEGADAIWLAERGWHVTAVDFAAGALARGAARAAELGQDVVRNITWLQRDVTDWFPDEGRYDLVSAHFMQVSNPVRDALFRRLAASVAAGGSLLVVGHHPSDLQTTVRRPPLPELFFTAADVAEVLDRKTWTIATSAARARSAVDAAGDTVTIHDAVLHARRLP